MNPGGDAPRWRRYLRFIRPDPVSDVDDELDFHVAMRIERNIALGMSPDDARRDALRRFGDVGRWREAVVDHDKRQQASKERQQIMSDFFQDLKYAVRSLRHASGMTAAVVLTLALGLGVNMAMFSFLDVVFLRPPAGVKEPKEVRRVWTQTEFRSGTQFWPGFSYPQYAAIRSALGPDVPSTIYRSPSDAWVRRGDDEVRAAVSHVDTDFFNLLGVRPFAGRFLSADENRLGSPQHVAVLSHEFWRTHLDADSAVIGRTISIASQPYTVLGVAAAEFNGVDLDVTDVWVPLATLSGRGDAWWQSHNVNGFQLLLRPDDRIQLADQAVESRVAIGLSAPEVRFRASDSAAVVRLGSINRAQGPGKKEQEVKIATRLAGVTIIVLLIACANVINLLLARAVRRRREIAVRLAMGISRLRLARLLLTESVLLAVLAAAGAVLVAAWSGTLLRVLLMPEVNWADEASPMHWRIIGLAIVLGLGAGLIAGILPVLQSLQTAVTGALKAGNGTSEQGRRSRVRDGLVVAQAALSMILLVGAALFVSSLKNVHGIRTGYDTARLIYAGVAFDTDDSVRDSRFPREFRGLTDRLRVVPGVEEIAFTRMVPTRGFSTITFHPDVDTTQYRKPFATYTLVSPEFFAVTGMRLVQGQGFPRVTGPTMPPVVIVNETFAKAQWPGMSAVGRCLRFPPEEVCYRVIGVAETAMFDKLIEEPQAQYYLPIDNPPAEAGSWFSTMIVKTQPGAREAVTTELRRVLRETFPSGRPSLSSMENVMEPEYRPWRLGATLFTAFGALALIVAALGIYSTVAYTVAQRTHEFGVRTALGAQTSDILSQVVGSSVRVVTVGVMLGVALAFAAGRFIAALLYGIEPTDPGVMIGVSLVLLLIAIAAALGPAWRAAKVNPVVALRSD
ncbi:MAG: ADOP family duplicated permease [Gemmatimonadaceae bacterium]